MIHLERDVVQLPHLGRAESEANRHIDHQGMTLEIVSENEIVQVAVIMEANVEELDDDDILKEE